MTRGEHPPPTTKSPLTKAKKNKENLCLEIPTGPGSRNNNFGSKKYSGGGGGGSNSINYAKK